MRLSTSTRVVRHASGLPDTAALRAPSRTARVEALVDRLPRSAVLPGLVHLAARCAGSACAQLSLLGDAQTATAVRCDDASYSSSEGALEDSLCTVTVLSGDVLVAADAALHPWLHDLPPVQAGAVRSYLGVPLRLRDGTAVGALCTYGPEPRDWGQEQITLVGDVADLVALELQRLADSA